jgi:hypothetical protein
MPPKYAWAHKASLEAEVADIMAFSEEEIADFIPRQATSVFVLNPHTNVEIAHEWSVSNPNVVKDKNTNEYFPNSTYPINYSEVFLNMNGNSVTI